MYAEQNLTGSQSVWKCTETVRSVSKKKNIIFKQINLTIIKINIVHTVFNSFPYS